MLKSVDRCLGVQKTVTPPLFLRVWAASSASQIPCTIIIIIIDQYVHAVGDYGTGSYVHGFSLTPPPFLSVLMMTVMK
jgi:hypothetical protein